jgi:predicted nucleotidyltransferase
VNANGSWYGEIMSSNQALPTSTGSIDVSPIQPILARVIERWQPLQIWLFGSRVRGDARGDSDWDLLAVVADCPEPADFDDPMTVWRVKREPGVPSDLFVWRATDFAEDRDVHNTLAYSATHEGILVYER